MRKPGDITYTAYIYSTGITITADRYAGVCGPIRHLDVPEGKLTATDLDIFFRGEGFAIKGDVEFEATLDGFRLFAELDKLA